MYKRTRTVPIQVYLTEDEAELLNKKLQMSGKRSKSDLIRQLIRDGYVFDIDFSDIQRYNFLLSNISVGYR